MGHIHEHEHDHIHEGGEQAHDHHHDHSHTHVDGTTHTHDHHHTHTHEGNDPGELKALLEYMIHHNAHHAEELANLLDSLPPQAQKKLTIAIGSFEAANVELQMVLDCL